MSGAGELLARVKVATGPDREINLALRQLDCEAFVKSAGWKLAYVGPDYDGANACEIWTPDGNLIDGFDYPRRGAISPYYHVGVYLGDLAYTASVDAALALVQRALPNASWGIRTAMEGGYAADVPFVKLKDMHPAPVLARTAPLAILAALLTSLTDKESGK